MNSKQKHKHNHISLASMFEDAKGSDASLIRRTVIICLICNLFLMAIKLTAGSLGHSEALVADGFHSLNDFASDFIVLIFIGFAYRKTDSRFTYGYGKFETFVSLLISIVLIAASVGIFAEGLDSIMEVANGKTIERPDFLTIVVALFAILAKEGLYHFMSRRGKRFGSSALIASSWHQRSDALASLATLTGVSCAHFLSEKWAVMDPIASLLIAAVVFVAAVRMLVPAFLELMEKALPAAVTDNIRQLVGSVAGVKEIKELKSRKNGRMKIVDITVAVDPSITVGEGSEIALEIEKKLHEAMDGHLLISVNTIPA